MPFSHFARAGLHMNEEKPIIKYYKSENGWQCHVKKAIAYGFSRSHATKKAALVEALAQMEGGI